MSPTDDSGLLRHGTLMVIGTFAGAVCNAGFHMVAGRLLPESAYGALVAMLGIVLAFSQPALALQNTLAHRIALLRQSGNAAAVPACFRRCLPWPVLLLVPLLPFLAWLLRAPLSAFWNVDPRLLILTAAILPLSLGMSLFSGLWQGMQSFLWLAFAPQAWGLVRLTLGAALMLLGLRTATAALAAQLTGVLLVLLLGLLYLSRLGARAARPPSLPSATASSGRYLLLSCLSLIGYGLLMNFDTALAKHLFPADSAGLFAKAATIARTAVFLPVPIAAALFPKVATDGALPPDTARLLRRALLYAGALVSAAAAACLILPSLPWLILYGPCPADTAPLAHSLVRAMTLAQSPLALTYLLLNFEMAQNRFRRPLLLLPCAALYILSTALLAPRLSLHSIPAALLLSSLLSLLLLRPRHR
jgi:O-antigen/teichoic acid export membrane protein